MRSPNHELERYRSQWFQFHEGKSGESALALQGSPIFWVAGHRRHHTYMEDIEKDPYSAKRGFWWSHMGWLLYKRPEVFEYESNRKFAPDLAKDAFYR